MPYDDPTLSELRGYFKAKEPGKRARAEAWATAIGLQDVDHLRVSSFLVETAIRHINGEITQEQAREIIEAHYASAKRPHTRSYYGGYEYFDPETGEKIESLDVYEAQRRLKRGIRQHKKKAVRKSGKKTVDKVWELLRDQPQLTFVGMVAALGITRSTIQKHIANLKKAGRLCRVGPDKGGHWEVAG